MGTLTNVDDFVQNDLKHTWQLIVSHTELTLNLFLKAGNVRKTITKNF